MAGPTHEAGLQIQFNPLGHFSLTVSTIAVGLPNLPDLSRIRRVIIRNLGQPVNWRDDGTDPTGSTGFAALSDEIIVYDGNIPQQFKIIRASGATGDCDCRIAYYGL